MSDPSNLYIPRCALAGRVINRKYVVLHNGIVVEKRGYYDRYSDILIRNKGVHEPAEERLFSEILDRMPAEATMVELGSYWAYYSIWFALHVSKAKNYCVEKRYRNAMVGLRNAKLNNVKLDITTCRDACGDIQQYMLAKGIKKVDILLMDIQGSEEDVILKLQSMIRQSMLEVTYFVISTHSEKSHAVCRKILSSLNYRIFASLDLKQTFFQDGVLFAVLTDNSDVPNIYLGSKMDTQGRNVPYDLMAIPGSGTQCKYLPSLFSGVK